MKKSRASHETSNDNKVSHIVTPLTKLSKNSEAVVSHVSKSNVALHRKLLSMGIVEGTKIRILAQAPLGGALSVRALGYQLSLRRSEASSIFVQAA